MTCRIYHQFIVSSTRSLCKITGRGVQQASY
jgi:hypothetical protein